MILIVFSQPDSSIEPFMDSLIREGGIENYFTMVLCGKGFNLSDPEGDLGGSLVCVFNVPVLVKRLLSIKDTEITRPRYY